MRELRILLLYVGVLMACGTAAHGEDVELTRLGGFATGVFDESDMEIAAYDAASKRLFVVSGNRPIIRIFDVTKAGKPKLFKELDISQWGASANSVAIHDGLVAAALEHKSKETKPGVAAFFDTDGNFLKQVRVGVLPDMITFSPNGTYVLVANEGQPDDEFKKDPPGSVTIIDISGGVNSIGKKTTTEIDFKEFDSGTLPEFVRVVVPDTKPSVDFEPEYIAVSADESIAVVSMQENNALAFIDLATKKITKLVGIPYKDHSKKKNSFDASNRDDGINIKRWPVWGMPQPDAIAMYEVGGKKYIVTANEGDAKDYDAFSEEARVEDLTLDPTAFPNAVDLQKEENLGRLKTTTVHGDTDGDGDHDIIYSYGARSFSILDEEGNLVYDSGNEFETFLAKELPDDFNSTNDENGSFDDRSDDKGPEPEGLDIGEINGRYYLFVGLERVGGVMVYDITKPRKPQFKTYVTGRNFSANAEKKKAGDLGPEGILFIPAVDSPTGSPLLVVTAEVSGSMSIYRVDVK